MTAPGRNINSALPLTKPPKLKTTLASLCAMLQMLACSWAGPGDPDPAFLPPPVVGGFPTRVSALAVQPDGKVLMGGNFSIVWGAERSGIARLNADGSLDTGFAPTNVAPDVTALAVQADGKVVVGIAYPASTAPSVMRLNPDGTTDTSFTAGFAGVSPQFRGTVALLVQPDGRVVASGGTVPGSAYLLRLQSNGSLDPPSKESLTESWRR